MYVSELLMFEWKLICVMVCVFVVLLVLLLLVGVVD